LRPDLLQICGDYDLTLLKTIRPVFGTPLFDSLMSELKHNLPAYHGKYDKIHDELAIEIFEVLWIGCLSQMKENRAAYSPSMTENLKQIIIDAFEVGRTFAQEKERIRDEERGKRIDNG
jgi:hypothetical protein